MKQRRAVPPFMVVSWLGLFGYEIALLGTSVSLSIEPKSMDSILTISAFAALIAAMFVAIWGSVNWGPDTNYVYEVEE